jgi:hypothetical protein
MDEQAPLSPEKAAVRAEIDRLLQADSYRSVLHPDHEKTQAHLGKLYSELYPEPEADPNAPAFQPNEPAKPLEEVKPAGPFEDGVVDEVEAKALDPLKAEWGTDWDSRVEAAQGVVRHLNRELGFDVDDFLEDSRLGSHPIVIRAMYDWSQGRPGPDVTPAQAKELLALATKSEIYRTGHGKTREAIVDLVHGLYSIAYDVQDPRA